MKAKPRLFSLFLPEAFSSTLAPVQPLNPEAIRPRRPGPRWRRTSAAGDVNHSRDGAGAFAGDGGDAGT